MKHNEWFLERVGTDSINAAAKEAGLVQVTLSRHLKDGVLPAESVIKIARAYDYNPVQALVDTGYMAPEEAQGEVRVINWDEVDDVLLCEEILRRAKINSAVGTPSVLDEPLTPETIKRVHEEAANTPPVGIQIVRDHRRRIKDDDQSIAALRPGYNAREEEDQ